LAGNPILLIIQNTDHYLRPHFLFLRCIDIVAYVLGHSGSISVVNDTTLRDKKCFSTYVSMVDTKKSVALQALTNLAG
jgi:hypothetical protein